jgi:hypothetical protein
MNEKEEEKGYKKRARGRDGILVKKKEEEV